MPTALLADDETHLLDHLEHLLGAAWPTLTIVGRASNGNEAIEMAHQLRPDVAFLDIRMPE